MSVREEQPIECIAYQRWCKDFRPIQKYSADDFEVELCTRHALLSFERDNTIECLRKGKSVQSEKHRRIERFVVSVGPTTINGMTIAQMKRSQVGKTFFSGGGWYNDKSEQRNARRTGLTKYLNNNHVKKTEWNILDLSDDWGETLPMINDTTSKTTFNRETGCCIGGRLKRNSSRSSSLSLRRKNERRSVTCVMFLAETMAFVSFRVLSHQSLDWLWTQTENV